MFSSHTLITGGTFTNHNIENKQIHVVKGSFERLQEAASPAAFHNSGDRRDPPKCHPNTRVAILEKIMNWILNLQPEIRDALIMWLHGPAGSGKSAIAQSIAEWAFDEGILLASYFFSRFDLTRNHPRSLIATVAYQAASYFPSVRDRILAAIDADPLIFTRSLITQIRTLIVEPFQHLIVSGYFYEPNSKRLIIIDGLDECEDRDGQVDILRTISQALQQHHLPLIFLVTSRPEHDITTSFGKGYLREIASRLPLDDEYQSSSDIRLFLQDEFNDIQESHPFQTLIPPEWPTENTLQEIVKKSSGQFIYAATVIKFVKSTRHRPSDRLDIVLGLRPTASCGDMPFAELDALYHHIFSCVQDIESVLQILAFEILLRPLFIQFGLPIVEGILSLNPGDIGLLVCDLHSVIELTNNYLHFLHASLDDFLLDKSRSKELYIDAPLRHAEFAQILFARRDYSPIFLRLYAWHLKRALPNNKLREDILNLDIAQCFLSHESTRYKYKSEFDLEHFPSLLRSMRESQFSDAEELHTHLLQSFDQYAVEQLKSHYYPEKRLDALLAVVSIPQTAIRKRCPNGVFIHVHDIFRLDEQLKSLDLRGLQLVRAVKYGDYAGYRAPKEDNYLDFLKVHFSDKTRVGIYAPDARTYANGAMHFLEYIRDHLSRNMLRYYGKKFRRNIPWKRRRRVVSKKDAYKRVLSNAQRWRPKCRNILPITKNYCDKMWCLDLRDCYHHFTAKACYYSMHFLANLLENAGRSEKLIALARKSTLKPFLTAFPDERRVAKEAIRLYLERMGEVGT